MPTSYDRSTPPVGRLSLDSPPPGPPVRKKPGDDTMSLLGAPNVNGEGIGISAGSPTGRALQGVAMMMQGANMTESVIPGAIPPPILQLIQQLSIAIPEITRNMQQMTGPGGMLSTMGMMGAGAPPSGMGGGEGSAMSGMSGMGSMGMAPPPMGLMM